jgi:2-polyprenyl-3-methyl-5-hydroxy-6-metoxy-1,4-benzoquinol methylase
MESDSTNNDRLDRERKHAEVLLADPEGIWGWGSPAGMARAQRRANLIIEAGHITSDSQTLEIGCGTGVFTEYISKTGAAITACELAEQLVDIAAKRSYSSDVQFLNQDISSVGPEYDNRYDVVWGSSVLHHLDLDVFLPKLFDLIKPGGYLVFAEPNMFNPQIWLERNVDFIRKKTGTSPDETAFYRWSLKKHLLGKGFCNVSIKPHEFLHPATPEFMIPSMQLLTSVAEKLWVVREIAGSLLIRAQKPEGIK